MKALQAKLFGILAGNGFVRRCKTDDALWVSDMPRRQGAENCASMYELLKAGGFAVTQTEHGLWLIDPDAAQWNAMLTSNDALLVLPDNARLLSVYGTARLLLAHPAQPECQPKPLLRAVLKRMDAPADLLSYHKQLRTECALLLRNKQPLPSTAGHWMATWINRKSKEGLPC